MNSRPKELEGDAANDEGAGARTPWTTLGRSTAARIAGSIQRRAYRRMKVSCSWAWPCSSTSTFFGSRTSRAVIAGTKVKEKMKAPTRARHRCAHGDEGLALHALKHQQRREDQRMISWPKAAGLTIRTRRGSSNLSRSRRVSIRPASARRWLSISRVFSTTTTGSAVDQKAEVQRAEAHQVSADAKAVHADDREQEADRDHQGGDRGRTDVAEQQEQHHDHR